MRSRLLILALFLGAILSASGCGDVTQITDVRISIDTVTRHDTTVRIDTVKVPSDTGKADTTKVPSGIAVVLQPAFLTFHLGAGSSNNQVYQLLWEVKHNGVRHTNQNITFSSVQNGVVSLGSSGLVHPLKTGTALIIATAAADTTKKDTTVVTVDGQPCSGTGCAVAGVAVAIQTSPPGTVITTMRVGTSQQLTVTVSGAADPTGTWSSSKPQFVLVNSQSGIVTAFSVGSSEICFSLRTNPTGAPPGCATFTVTN
ncbi:MAG: hypothetical protein ACYC1K_01650 [Minisyncoccota bacterium]